MGIERWSGMALVAWLREKHAGNAQRRRHQKLSAHHAKRIFHVAIDYMKEKRTQKEITQKTRPLTISHSVNPADGRSRRVDMPLSNLPLELNLRVWMSTRIGISSARICKTRIQTLHTGKKGSQKLSALKISTMHPIKRSGSQQENILSDFLGGENKNDRLAERLNLQFLGSSRKMLHSNYSSSRQDCGFQCARIAYIDFLTLSQCYASNSGQNI